MKKDKLGKDFVEKYRTDKKFKAKVQLIVYSIFILLLIVSLNFSGSSSSKSSSFHSSNHANDEKMVGNIFPSENNYSYDVHITYGYQKDEELEMEYSGSVYLNRMKIEKKALDTVSSYYKKDSRYYRMVDDSLELVHASDIYDVISSEFIELPRLMEYLDLASLDHVTDYSNGNREYVYHLLVKDVVVSHPEVDEIEIKLKKVDGQVFVDVDYYVLLKAMGIDVSKCVVSYVYKDFDKVEEFDILNEG